jgi:thermostable 8-oxoguanine DNA glycosylase
MHIKICLDNIHYQSLTERELLVVHAEVKALQQMYGLSYKDAAHCLYHSEIQKLTMADHAYRHISTIRQGIDQLILEDISEKIAKIDCSVEESARQGDSADT